MWSVGAAFFLLSNALLELGLFVLSVVAIIFAFEAASDISHKKLKGKKERLNV